MPSGSQRRPTRTAHKLTTDARTRAGRVESEARVDAERLNVAAHSRAEKLDRESESRRAEMFDERERRRDHLTAAVGALRDFEVAYRTNLTGHLRKEIETLESGRAEPEEVPDLARDQLDGLDARAYADERARVAAS